MSCIELFNFPNSYMFYFLFRWLIGDEYSIHFSFMLSVLIKSATFLICLRNSNNTVSTNIHKSAYIDLHQNSKNDFRHNIAEILLKVTLNM